MCRFSCSGEFLFLIYNHVINFNQYEDYLLKECFSFADKYDIIVIQKFI